MLLNEFVSVIFQPVLIKRMDKMHAIDSQVTGVNDNPTIRFMTWSRKKRCSNDHGR